MEITTAECCMTMQKKSSWIGMITGNQEMEIYIFQAIKETRKEFEQTLRICKEKWDAVENRKSSKLLFNVRQIVALEGIEKKLGIKKLLQQ